LVQVPAGGRTPLQRLLNACQQGWLPRILLLLGSALLLALLWIVDSRAALASTLSPLDGSSRLTTLILAIPLLTLLLWQWQQLGQALWLLGRSPDQLEQGSSGGPTPDIGLLSLGLPLLLLNELQGQENQNNRSAADRAGTSAVPSFDRVDPAAAVAVEPEKTNKEDEGSDLDQQVD
jgi:hypothetical protein